MPKKNISSPKKQSLKHTSKNNAKPLQVILGWLDNNILLLLSGFLLIFIPLYPKIPLAELIPGYIVRMRLEDVFVLLTALVWGVQVVRKKVRYQSITLWLIGLYLAISALSLLSAATITQTIPWQALHLGKSLLHWFRYLEYFMLFAITFSAIKSPRDIKLLLKLMFLTLLAVVIYGYGQKYHYWPVFSTMNREFSKGVRLYLTEYARIQSTFGGHYDLAGYLVILLNLALAIALNTQSKVARFLLHTLHLLGLWLLVSSASRISFIAYLVGAIIIIALCALLKSSLWQKISYFLSRSLAFALLVGLMMIVFGKDMRDRLFHVLRDYPQVESTYLKTEEASKQVLFAVINTLKISIGNKTPGGKWIPVELKDQTLAQQDSVLDKTDQQPSKDKPQDVYVDIPDKVRVATQSATGEKSYVIVERERTWSENAIKYGLSAAIRLDTLWPNAIQGFLRNPVFGTGYATLNKEGVFHFTEAESTDNNFLRVLGETGLLGFAAFYGLIGTNVYLAWMMYRLQQKMSHQQRNTLYLGLAISYIGISIGLLINALYIDVFASSKVAFTYWALTGILIVLCYQEDTWQQLKMTWLVQALLKLRNNFKKMHLIKSIIRQQ